MRDREKEKDRLLQEADDEIERKMDSYQAVLEAALLKKPFPKVEDEDILDLTPPEDDEDEGGEK